MTNAGRGTNHSCDVVLGMHGFESFIKTLKIQIQIQIEGFGGRRSVQRVCGWQIEGCIALWHGEHGHIQLLINLIVLRSRGHVLEEIFRYCSLYLVLSKL
jgi:hypothetical protein